MVGCISEITDLFSSYEEVLELQRGVTVTERAAEAVAAIRVGEVLSDEHSLKKETPCLLTLTFWKNWGVTFFGQCMSRQYPG